MEKPNLKKLIPEIVRRLLFEEDIKRLILFGSTVQGTINKDSDLDLIVIKNSLTSKYQEMIRLRRMLKGLGIPIDLLVISSTEFDEKIKSTSNIYSWANKSGKIIYDSF